MGALQHEFGCILVEKGCKQVAKSKKKVKKVCSKPYVFHRFSVCLACFLSKICVTGVIYTCLEVIEGVYCCWVKFYFTQPTADNDLAMPYQVRHDGSVLRRTDSHAPSGLRMTPWE